MLVGRPVIIMVSVGVDYMVAMPDQKQPGTLTKRPEKYISCEPALSEVAQFKQRAAQGRCRFSCGMSWLAYAAVQ